MARIKQRKPMAAKIEPKSSIEKTRIVIISTKNKRSFTLKKNSIVAAIEAKLYSDTKMVTKIEPKSMEPNKVEILNRIFKKLALRKSLISPSTSNSNDELITDSVDAKKEQVNNVSGKKIAPPQNIEEKSDHEEDQWDLEDHPSWNVLFNILESEVETPATLEELSPEELFPEELFLEELTPEELFPEELFLEELSPEELSPEELSPEELSPEELSPEELSPEELSPEELSPEELYEQKVAEKWCKMEIDLFGE